MKWPSRDTRRGPMLAGFVIAFGLVLATASAILAVLGVMNFSRASEPIATLKAPIASVERGAVVDAVEGKFVVSADREWVVFAPVGVSSGLITRPGASEGSVVADGDVVGTVNERPIVVAASAVPFYRAMSVGDEGRDVAEMQHWLTRLKYSVGRDRDGVYGVGTARAVFAFYKDRGYSAVDSGGQALSSSGAGNAAIPQGELVAVAAVPVVAKTTCGAVGDGVTAATVCTLVSESTRTVISFAESSSTALKPGLTVHLTYDGGTQDGKLGELQRVAATPPPTDQGSAEASGDSSSASAGPAYEVVLAQALPISTSGVGSVILKSSSEDALRVPEIAIHSGIGGKLWLVSQTGAKVPVTTTVCAQGFCAIEGHVSVGLKVRLPLVASQNG